MVVQENTLRAGPSQGRGERSPVATQPAEKCRKREPTVMESLVQTERELDANGGDISYGQDTQEDQLTSIIERNSLKSEESANPGRCLCPGTWCGSRAAQMEAWTCFACAWAFSPSGPPCGKSLEEMMQNYELQRDKEYACHVCTEHPRANVLEIDFKFSGAERSGAQCETPASAWTR